jgi:hypothetical protein
MGLDGWKKAFYWGAGIWLFGTVVIQIARRNSDNYSTIQEIDNFNTLFALVGLATFCLGTVLFCRWAWLKFQSYKDVSSDPSRKGPRSDEVSNPSSNSTMRWEALVRYDDEIRAAAEKLMPFGPEWVNRLGDAFFALSEDRSYLANIVERLRNEAKLEAEIIFADGEWRALHSGISGDSVGSERERIRSRRAERWSDHGFQGNVNLPPLLEFGYTTLRANTFQKNCLARRAD